MNFDTSIFLDSANETFFKKNGYVVLENKYEKLADTLSAAIAPFIQSIGQSFYYSLIDETSFDRNKQIQSAISPTLNALLADTLRNYRLLNESFLIKPAHNLDKEMHFHQDWSYTNEAEYQSLTIWFPLQDVSEQNGAIFLIPGSHNLTASYRSATYLTQRFNSDLIAPEKMKTIQLKKGSCLIFHPALFHGSFSNHSSNHRVVVAATVLPVNAPYLYAQKTDETTATLYQMDDLCFLHQLKEIAHLGLAPISIKSSEFIYREIPITLESISNLPVI